jgi:DNA segregation ATPase FtsK/SpoIIIE, S-DNA-T family
VPARADPATPLPPRPRPPAGPRGTRAWTLWSAEGALDIEVDAADGTTLGDVLAALRSQAGLPASALWCGSTPLPGTATLGTPALAHGAVLGLDRPGPRPGQTPSGALELQVVGGPDAGRVVGLGQGDLVIGRSAACGLALTDPDVSRRHARVTVGSGQVTLTDLGSRNGTVLRGATGETSLDGSPRPWTVGSTVLIGASAVRLSGPRGTPLECTPAPAGRTHVRPVPVSPIPLGEVSVRAPAPPPDPLPRRLGWITLVLPAVGGLLMAWLMSAPQFLFFALLSPVVALGGWLSDRLTGRRHRRRAGADHAAALARFDAELDAAVAVSVAALDDAHPDPARLATAARRRSSPLWARSRADADLLLVRLGTGTVPTAVHRVDADGTRTAVTAGAVPVTVDLGEVGSLGVVGPRTRVCAVARGVVLQLATMAAPGELRIVVVAAPQHLPDWSWTRWLPAVRTVVSADAPAPGSAGSRPAGPLDDLPPDDGSGTRTLVLIDSAVSADTATALGTATGVACLALARSDNGLPVPTAGCLTVSGETGVRGRLRLPGSLPDRELALDGVPEPVAAATARALAALAPPARTGGLPDTAALVDLPSGGLRVDPEAGLLTGRWDRTRQALTCTLGHTAQGPLILDLCAQGPHLLVAGTTGSGKSELLRTLVSGLALHHPPDRVSFLLVDYKGGAAFAEAAGLPHTVGMLTDLDPQSTVRALRSLTAELTRRERLLARHDARDLAELGPEIPLARLVIVVDEFATLAEELPEFVSGLVGIAQRGRSLGVHLVLGTQRPSGVVSPEIRANCSLRICLRTTDESDSRDVLGTALAAFLPASRPGRAYLRAGGAAPVLFQVARVTGSSAGSRAGVRVRRLCWPPVLEPAEPGTPARPGHGDLAQLVDALRGRAVEDAVQPPDRPWLPALPERLPAEDLDRRPGTTAPTRLRIGLVDSPDTQSQQPLVVDLSDGGGWLAVGGPRSGRTTVLRAVLRAAVHQLAPAQLHVHVLDHGGGTLAEEAGLLPHTGTAVGRDDAHRSVRLLARLQLEVDRRRAGGHRSVPLLLLIDGYESLAAQLDGAEPGTGSGALLRLVRDGAAVGLTCVVTAERAVPGSRVAAAMGHRLVLPFPDRADYAVLGIGPRSVPGCRPPGRALVGEDSAECQLAAPRSGAPMTGPPAAPPPVRVVALPADPALDLPEFRAAGGPLWLPVGPGDDDGQPVGLDLVRTGGLLVVGPAGSGRTSALTAFARHCAAAGARVLHLAPAPAGAGSGADGADGGDGDRMAPSDVAGLRAWAARDTGRPAVVVADDVGALPEATADALAALVRPGGDLVVLAAGDAHELAGTFRGPAAVLRRTRTALLLRPAPGDAELLGMRLPRTAPPARPGAGWLVAGTTVSRVQVARHRVPAGGGERPGGFR